MINAEDIEKNLVGIT